MQLMLGQTLRRRYQIIRLLGSGGFSETYLAEDKDLPGNPLCVVKQLKPKDSDPSVLQTAKRLFETEAQVLYRLGKHEQIPQLFAYFEENQELYLVQEFFAGEDLDKEFYLDKLFNESKVLELLKDVLNILGFIHQQNVIHRDVKPTNLIRRKPDGKMILVDFGAVKEIEYSGVNQAQKNCTVLIGSPGYMPQEQKDGEPRFSSDIYALGMTAIQAITGILPEQFPADLETGEICWREQAQVSNELAMILEKMVRSHFRDRYQSTDEVLEDLHKLNRSTTVNTELLPEENTYKDKFVKLSYLLTILVTAIVTFGFTKLLEPTSSKVKPAPPTATPTPLITITPSPQIPEALEFFNQGNTLIELRRYDEAIALLDKVLQFQPNNVEALVKRGLALTELQKPEEALKSYDEAIKLQSDYSPAWYYRGLVLEKLQREEEALTSFDKSVALQPDFAPAWYDRGLLLEKRQRHQEALSSLEKAVQIKPDYWQALYQRGEILNKLKRYSEALNSLDQALPYQSADLKTWVERGYALGQLQKYEQAIASFDKALQLDPNSAEAWGKRGYVLGKLKRYEEAIASLDKATQLKSDYAEAWYFRGMLLEQLQKYQEAIAAYDKAAQIKADYSEAWYRRGLVLEKMQKNEEAIAAYDKAIQIWPANEEAIGNRKRLLTKLKQ